MCESGSVDAGTILHRLLGIFGDLDARSDDGRVLWVTWVCLLVDGSGWLWNRRVVDRVERRNCSGVRRSDCGGIDWFSQMMMMLMMTA